MAKLKEITVSLGMSVDKNGLWIKPGLSATLEIDPSEDKIENRSRLLEEAFAFVSEGLEDQLSRLLDD